jgi:outer membrane protein TolC
MRRLLLAMLLLAAGCAVDQQREVRTYRNEVDLDAREPFDPSRPLSLRQALLLANEWNEDLSIEGEAYLRSIIERRRAIANFLPTLDLSPRYSVRENTGSGENTTLDAPLELRLNLFNGFRDAHAYWRDTYLIERQRQTLLSAQETLLIDVSRVYYQVLRAEASVEVLTGSLAVQEERLRDTRGRFSAGLARALDVAQTEAQVSETRVALIRAKNDVLNARSLLAFLIRADVERTPLSDLLPLPGNIEPLETYYDLAAAHREDLAAAGAAVSAARHDVEVAVGQYYPSVNLDLSAFLYRESIPDSRTWEAMLSANLPIFSAGRIEADVREAWSFFREALLVESLLRRQVRQEVEMAYQNLAASEARLAELQVALAAAEQAFQQAEQSYRAGLATNLDRVTAQDALLRAQLDLASEIYDRKVLYLNLKRAAGMLREELETMPALPMTDEATTQPAPSPRGPLRLGPVRVPMTQPATRPAG